jgi:hypothetical protein
MSRETFHNIDPAIFGLSRQQRHVALDFLARADAIAMDMGATPENGIAITVALGEALSDALELSVASRHMSLQKAEQLVEAVGRAAHKGVKT